MDRCQRSVAVPCKILTLHMALDTRTFLLVVLGLVLTVILVVFLGLLYFATYRTLLVRVGDEETSLAASQGRYP